MPGLGCEGAVMQSDVIFDSGLWLGQTRWTWDLLQQPAALVEALLRVALPIVLALLVVQGSARVLRAAFPESKASKRGSQCCSTRSRMAGPRVYGATGRFNRLSAVGSAPL